MQFKVRVKTNDNDNVEEWITADLLLAPFIRTVWLLRRQVDSLLDCILTLEKENAELDVRIVRLECILARNGTPEAIELRSQLIRDVNGHEKAKADEEHYCPRCRTSFDYSPRRDTATLCIDCESELAEEQGINEMEMWGPGGRPEGRWI